MMSLVPFVYRSSISDLTDFDKLFDNLFDFSHHFKDNQDRFYNIYESDSQILITVPLAVPKANLSATVEGTSIYIKVSNKYPNIDGFKLISKLPSRRSQLIQESNEFEYKLTIPANVNANSIKLNYIDGILYIYFDKTTYLGKRDLVID